jgi:hypothetical protein
MWMTIRSVVHKIDPRQPFFRINVLRGWEILRTIETFGSNVDFIGALVVLIGERGSTATTKRPPRSCLRLIGVAFPSRIQTVNVLL